MLQTKIAIATILTIIYLLKIPCEIYSVSSCSAWWTHFTYQFLHGNILHLLSNTYAILLCLNDKTFPKHALIPLLYTITVAASFVGIQSTPTVGISGAIFAMLGINFVRIPTPTNTIYIIIILIAGFLIPQIAGTIHLVSFLMGSIIAVFTQNIKHFKHDYR